IVIDDIRPVNTRIVCMPSGLLVLYGSQGGGDYINLGYNLDAARPVAHEISTSDIMMPEFYFTNHTIPVAPKDTAQIGMILNGARHAYTFDIEIEYLENGAKHTVVFEPKGGPLKVTASACPSPADRKELTDQDVARLRQHRFQ